jgi:fucose permease
VSTSEYRRSPAPERELLELGSARVSVSVLFVAFGMLVSTWVSRIPTIQRDLHLSNAELGLAELGLPIGQLLMMRLVAGMVHRWSSASVARWGVVAACMSLVLIGVTRSVIELAVALVALGMALGAFDTSMNTQAVAVERGRGRPTMSSFHGVFSVGVLVGSALGSAAAGFGVSPLEQAAAMSVVVLAITAAGTRSLLGIDADRIDVEGAEPASGGPRQKLRLQDHKILIVIGAMAFCALFAEGAAENWSGVLLRHVEHASFGVASLGVTAIGAGMAIGRFSGDRFITNWGRTRVLLFSTVVGIAGMSLALVGGSIGLVIAGFALFGLGIAAIVPIAFTVAGNATAVPPAWALSRVAAIGYVGQLASPAVIGLTAQAAGLTGALVLPIVLLAVVVPITLKVRPS